MVCVGGASVFGGLENNNILAQGWHITTRGTYYSLSNEDLGSLEFRYWLGTNKHDYKRMITFFNMQNNNKAVKEA